MKKISQAFKSVLLVMVFLVIFIHDIYKEFNFIRIPPLKGDVKYAPKPTLANSSWFDGSFQEQQETFINDNFGFRSLYVRLNNQIRFSLFDKINAKGVVLGKDKYLFEENYINAYTGKDFIGESSIRDITDRIKFISDTLNKINKHLIIIIAAGKASFYPEYIPEKYLPASEATNYNVFKKYLERTEINLIDFNKWFVENKYKSKYPLYPKYGIHWSAYGAALAADSIIRFIEKMRGIDVPNLIYNEVDLKKPFGADYDIANGMNLLFKFKREEMAYPRISTESAKNKVQPSVLVISDSFYWGMYYFGISKSFKNDHFWYYNQLVYPQSLKKEMLSTNLDLSAEIQNHDVFIIMATEASLNKLGWGFLERMEKHFKAKTI